MSSSPDDAGATTLFFQWQRTMIAMRTVQTLNVRDKRMMFTVLRQPSTDNNTFVPAIGMTVGEFAVLQVCLDK